LLVEGVEYVKVDGAIYEMPRFEANVIAVQKQDKTLFSHIVIDSGSEPERTSAKTCEDNDDVHFYTKLPRWFSIETSGGAYKPDWALVCSRSVTFPAPFALNVENPRRQPVRRGESIILQVVRLEHNIAQRPV
jgi:hypothetical protein